MAHMKVYEDYKAKLVTVLPMNDVTFTTQLSRNKILPDHIDDHIKSSSLLPTESYKADYYLKKVIKQSLDTDGTEELKILITVMEKCGYRHVERLAKGMKSDLDKELKGISPTAVVSKENKQIDYSENKEPIPASGGNSGNVVDDFAIKDDDDDVIVDKLWKKDELRNMGYGKKKISTLPDDDEQSNILDEVVLLLLTVNDNEDYAALCYLEPLPGHDEIFKHYQREDDGVQSQHAIYLIGKYGACQAAVRKIKPGAEIGGVTTVPNLAFKCFKNLNAIIGMGVACGVEKKVKLCDVLVADKVNNYDQARLQKGGPLSRGYALPTSDLLSSIFRQEIMWPDDEIKERLEECNVKPKIKQGIILSGPYLIDDTKIKKELIQSFASEAIGIEMEAAYLFKAAQQVPTHMTIVKAVCDFGDGQKNKDFQPTAALLAANCVKRYLDEGAVKMLHTAKASKSKKAKGKKSVDAKLSPKAGVKRSRAASNSAKSSESPSAKRMKSSDTKASKSKKAKGKKSDDVKLPPNAGVKRSRAASNSGTKS